MMGNTLDSRGLDEINKIPLVGYVNGIAIGPRARFCVVASGQEPRLGRWNRVAKAKNRFGIIQLRPEEDGAASDDEGQEPFQEVANSASESENED
jgi:hypothetical protein